MALLSINGVALPTPSEYSVDILDLSKAERNANGTMLIERITTKRKIAVKYAYVNANDMKTLLNSLSPTFFEVTYLDPSTNTFRTSSFYCGDRSAGMIDFISDVARYKDLSFNLIER